MDNLKQRLIDTQVEKGHVAVFYMGQAGFAFKGSDGRIIAMDIYLSDCAERIAGFKRLTEKPIKYDDVNFDIIIATHAHCDHFDYDAIPTMMKCGNPTLYTSKEGVDEAAKLGIKAKLMERGGKYTDGDLTIEAVYCDHGELAPDAVGIILTLDGKRIYISGDTAYRPTEIKAAVKGKIDFMTAPANGAFGNLNEEESADLCNDIKPLFFVPCHCGTFAEHGGDLEKFRTVIDAKYPSQPYKIMKMGEMLTI